ncbi:hypothetical protein SH449x_000274 [Pirellulaceae bacterium SH449]
MEANAMGTSRMGSKDGELIESVGQMVGKFTGQLYSKLGGWENQLMQSPDSLEAVEREIQEAFLYGAGMVTSGLIAVVLLSKDLERKSEETRRGFDYPLARGRNRNIRIRLLGGFFMWISSLYCEPKKGVFRRTNPEVSGLYIELAQFGFGKGVTPAVQSTVARQAALSPSFKFAVNELARNGLKLDTKTVRRITNQCGENLLQLRKQRILDWRMGKMTRGDSLAGKRVSVQIDGGRTRLREALKNAVRIQDNPDSDGLLQQDAAARSKPVSKSSYAPQWREPKLCTIFVHDENGRMEKHSQATIDGTFEGPDAIAELVAMHLHRMGAAQALSITFVSDGATWIWERIDAIVSKAGIPAEVKIHQVLDCCHGVHHISLALACLGLNEAERMPLYRVMRTMLRNGQWQQVVDDLSDLAEDKKWPSSIATEIEYLRKHGEAGRLSYVYFRKIGIPLGSGSIESSIRRVVNNRMKGNGMFWRADNAETMLQLRCQVTSERWDESVAAMRNMNRKTNHHDWRWIPNPMNLKVEANKQDDPKIKKSQGKM